MSNHTSFLISFPFFCSLPRPRKVILYQVLDRCMLYINAFNFGRSKLKQTEVDCELLKKCCETLTSENKRLQKELQELKSLKLASPVYMQLPAATLTMCPSCERICSGSDQGSSTSTFTVGPKPNFYNPSTHSSAAC